MRIIGGFHRGKKILAPRGSNTRPTTDFVREALFNIIGSDIIGATFLDIFAGTGAVGLEALSRGAKKAVFIEKNTMACNTLKKNIENLKEMEKAYTVKDDALAGLKQMGKNNCVFDIAFLDPPYHDNIIEPCLDLLWRFKMIRSTVVLQYPKNKSIEVQGFTCYKHRVYGKTALSFLKSEE